MRPALQDCIPMSYTVEEMRASYAPTPLVVRQLFTRDMAECEGDGWIVEALHTGDVHLFEAPLWVRKIASVWLPSIKIDPYKSPGFWRVHSEMREWYVSSEELARACK